MPIKRPTVPDIPILYSRPMAQYAFPGVEAIETAVKEIML